MDDQNINPVAVSDTSSDESQSQPTQVSDTLFIGNLSWNVGDEELATFFTQKDDEGNVIFEPKKDENGVLMAKIIRDREQNNRSKGFGFVTFESTDMASKAKDAKDGQLLDDREVRIQFKIDRPREDRPRRSFNGADGGERRFGGGNSGSSDRGGFNRNAGGGGNNRRFDRGSRDSAGGDRSFNRFAA